MSGIRFIPSQSGVGSRVGIGLSAVVGPTGAIGPTGANGLQGPAGVASMTGATGLQGFQGLVGATGAGFQGLVGPTGPSNPGVQGLVGATGATGLQGLVGSTGSIGLQGLVGATGAAGLQGLAGSTGAEGQNGLQGLVGATGATGQNGLQGLAGSTGSIGPQGNAGMGFVVFANTTSYTGLNTVIATGGNIGQFVLVLGGDLFVYAGTGSGYTGPGNSYGYAGDITDESKLVGTQGAQGSLGPQGSQYTGPFTDLTVSGTSYLNNVVASGNMSGANAYFVNLAGENLAAQGAAVGFSGLTVVGGTTLIGVLQATGGINAPTATINNLVVTGSITLPTGSLVGYQGTQGLVGLQGTQGLVGLQGSQYTGPFTQLTVSGASSLNTVTVSGYMTGTTASFSFLKVTDLVVGGETGGSLYINTGVVSNLTVMNQIITGNLTLATGATIGSAGDTIFTDASFNVANVFTVNAYNGDVISTGTFIGATGVFDNLSITSELHLATGTIITGDLTLSTGSSIGSSGDTLFTDASLNVANVFTVNSYNGDVISTGTFIGATGIFSNIKAITETITGTSYLNNVVASGNMSGANAYFQNLAGQNLAAQGAAVGFSGLSVVGTTSLIGALYATGGINSQGVTTTTLAATTATIPNLTVTNLVVGGETGGSLFLGTGVITNLTVGEEIVGTVTATTGSITNLTSTTATINTLSAPVLSSTTGSITNLTSTTTTVSGTSYLNNVVASGNMSGANAYFVNLAGENLAAQGASVGFNGLLVVGGTTLIGSLNATGGITTTTLSAASSNITSLTATTATIPTLSSTTGTITNLSSSSLTATSATIPTLSSTLATINTLSAPVLSSTTGSITNLTSSVLTATNATISTATIPNLNVTNLVVGSETGGSLYINTGVVSNLTVMNQIITGQLILSSGATIGSASDTIFTDASFNVANIFTVNAYNWDVMATGALTASTGSFGKINVDRELHLSTGAIVTGDLTLSTGSAIASLGDTLFTDASLNVANVFTVNAYNWDVLATGALTASSGSFGKLRATTATVSGTTYLNDTISSGNMSGSNGYFLNLAGQNLASQGAAIGFSGLTVVGTTSLIGALYATGGINSQGVTTTTLSTSYSSSTGTSAAVTSNTTRGKIVIPTGSSLTSATVTNSLVTSDSSVFATITPRVAGEFIEGIDVLSGEFTIHLNSSSGSDININWLVIN